MDCVRIAYDAAPRPTTDELDAAIAVEWDRQLALAQGTDRLLFNGELLRYVRHDVRPSPRGEVFTLTVGPTCYRDFVGTNLYNKHRLDEFGWERFANPIVAVVPIDAFAAVARELEEELGLRREELHDLVCVGMIRDKEIHQPEMLFEARIELTVEELRQRWQTAEAKSEHDEIVSLPDEPGAIAPFIRSCGPIAPVAVGALFIHEKLRHFPKS